MAEAKDRVALQTTRVFSPYKEGEVFGLPKKEAARVVKKSKGAVVYYKAPKSESKSGSTSKSGSKSGSDSKAKTSKK